MNALKNIFIRLCTLFIFSSKKKEKIRNKYLNPNNISGINNKILIIENGIQKDYSYKYIDNLRIHIDGNNNLIKIEFPCNVLNSKMIIRGNNNIIDIKKCHPTGLLNAVFSLGAKANNRKILIEENFSCGGVEFTNNTTGNIIQVGKDCMFSEEVCLRADDGHVIYDEYNNVINNSQFLKIGNHVWLSRRTYVGKNVEIADNCIIGFGAIVTKSQLEKNTIIAGNPARIIKHNINWERYNHNKVSNTPKTLVAVERERERERERVIPLFECKIA